MTLNQLIDDVLLEARNSNIGESEKLSRHQIEIWIKTYRAQLIKNDIDKGRTVNPMYTQTIKVDLQKKEHDTGTGHYVYEGTPTLPQLIDFNFKPGVTLVKDGNGNLIQLGSETKMKFQKYRKCAGNDYIAYIKENKLYVECGGNTQLGYVYVDLIAQDPNDVTLNYNPNEDEYPMPYPMWGTIKDLIFSKDFRVLSTNPSDETNDTHDDVQNVHRATNRYSR